MTKHIQVLEPQRLDDYYTGYYDGVKAAEIKILQDLHDKIKYHGTEGINEILNYINARYIDARYKQEDTDANPNH